MDAGLLVTALALAAAIAGRGGWLVLVLATAWLLTLALSLVGVDRATMVAVMAATDIAIAGAALIVWTSEPKNYRARTIGGISMALMPAHWVMSLSHGQVDWTLYALACNAAFVLQCLTIGGWLDYVGSRIGSFFARLRPVHLLRRGSK